ncbi:hypothetical protein L2E82_10955 [Cichorium intybus]|uniref:Uncharacterized protein n=1 Tax=Cichorium intybus TaxID=13427 RepID=A0ACB9GC11_CICIN|nr:hypothetical protein L2E82_10955 [Cichorium intybus]
MEETSPESITGGREGSITDGRGFQLQTQQEAVSPATEKEASLTAGKQLEESGLSMTMCTAYEEMGGDEIEYGFDESQLKDNFVVTSTSHASALVLRHHTHFSVPDSPQSHSGNLNRFGAVDLTFLD